MFDAKSAVDTIIIFLIVVKSYIASMIGVISLKPPLKSILISISKPARPIWFMKVEKSNAS